MVNNRVLMISPVPVLPDFAGNRRRIREICRIMMDEGFVIDFYYCGFETPDFSDSSFINGDILRYQSEEGKTRGSLGIRLNEWLNRLAMETGNIRTRLTDGREAARYNQVLSSYRNVAKRELLREQVSNRSYRAVIVNYACFTHYFDLFDEKVIKITDTHDRLGNRYKLFLDHGVNPPDWRSLNPKEEAEALRKSDRVWAITESERNDFSRLIGMNSPEISTIPFVPPFQPLQPTESPGKKTVLAVSGRGDINIIALNWFLDHVWKPLISTRTDTELLVAGTLCEDRDKLNDASGIRFYGRYEDPAEVYRDARLCINPIRFGTGLKIKTIEALSFGRPVLTTTEGASGMETFHNSGLMIHDDPESWISEINRILDAEGPDGEVNLSFLLDTFSSLREQIRQRVLQSVNHTKEPNG